jgi:hypothetical protein
MPNASEKAAHDKPKRGRSAPMDPDAPHGRDENGEPLAPHGYLGNGKPRRYPVVRTDHPDLTIDMLTMGIEAPPEDIQDQTAPARARDEQQMAMDELAERLYDKWAREGKPATWPALLASKVVAGYWVAPDAVAGLKKIVDKAADYHGHRARWGTLANRSRSMEQDGKVFASFAIVDKRSPGTENTEEA